MRHGVGLFRPFFLFLPVAVHQNDGVIHGQAQLQDGADGIGVLGYGTENQVGSHVKKDRHSDGKQKNKGFRVRSAHDEKNQQQDLFEYGKTELIEELRI